MIRRAAGMARSLITYYGPVWRRRRFEAFYRQFLHAGDLAFDIGAHVGNRVRVFRRIGAHVVADAIRASSSKRAAQRPKWVTENFT
jgi:hypothetical protein